MILKESDIKDILLTNPNKALINEAKLKNKKYRMHMYGIMMENYITTIKGFERQDLRDLRAKYTKSNKDLFARLKRPIDKVFTARGGSLYFNLSESLNKLAMVAASNVRDGYSVKRWIEAYWTPHFLDDPNGLIFMEIGSGVNYPAGKVYPTYKPITTVFDYETRGCHLEYIIFEVSNAEKKAVGIKPEDRIYRVVDDAFDYYVKLKAGKGIEILDNLKYPNYFLKVPAIINSDINDPNADGLKLSLFDDIISVADEYLLKGSIKLTHDFRHAFPKYWEYADDCAKCGGTTVFDSVTCSECKGSGKSLMTNVSRSKILSWPQTKDDPQVAPNVAGYVEPSKTYHEIATADMAMLEDTMNYTIWGANSRKRTTGLSTDSGGNQTQTATEIIENMQPQNDRLNPISDSAEKRIKFILDHIVELEVKAGYAGSSVNMGRRYLTENPDTIWERYVNAREAGASVSLMDELYIEFIENKYSDDPVGMEIMLKLMQVEPFVHKTEEQVKGYMVCEEDYLAKIYYGEWLNQVSDSEILFSTVEELRSKLTEYTSVKEMAVPEPIKPPKIGFN